MRIARVLLAAGLLALGTAWLTVPADAQSANHQINVVGPPYAFSPASGFSIQAGRTVLWENQTSTLHDATSAEWGSRTIPAGVGERSQPVTINGPAGRTITYTCSIHGFQGSFAVVEGSPTTQATAPPATTPPTQPAQPSATTRRSTTATTRRATGTTVGGAATTIAGDFSVLAPTTTQESTTSTTGDVAIREDDDSGGSNAGVIAALAVGLAAILGGGAYALARLRRSP